MQEVNLSKQYSRNIESYFSSLVKQKNIILVGPARTLIGKELGEKIDSYDAVVRTNNFFGIIDDMHIDYGKRCDILYLNPKTTRMYGINKNGRALHPIDRRRGTLFSPVPIKNWEKKGLKVLVKLENDGIYIENKTSVGLKMVPVELTTLSRYNALSMKRRPLLGTTVIADLLRYNPKSLYVTGFDFYVNCRTWIDGYPTEQKDGNHDYVENARFMNKMINDGKINVDDELYSIIQNLSAAKVKKRD